MVQKEDLLNLEVGEVSGERERWEVSPGNNQTIGISVQYQFQNHLTNSLDLPWNP